MAFLGAQAFKDLKVERFRVCGFSVSRVSRVLGSGDSGV